MTKDIELLPCPFCGGEPINIGPNEQGEDEYRCWGRVADEYVHPLIEMTAAAWNRRRSTDMESERPAPAAQVGGVVVKPLEWKPNSQNNPNSVWTGEIARLRVYYSIEPEDRVFRLERGWMLSEWPCDDLGLFPSRAAAEDHANLDWASLSAIPTETGKGDDDDQTLASACRKYNIGTVARLDEVISELRAVTRTALSTPPLAVQDETDAEFSRGVQIMREKAAPLLAGMDFEQISPVQALNAGDGEKLGRFDHHPDPAIDFEIEVQSLEARLFDAKGGISKPGTTPETVAAVLEDIERAMTFRVGGDVSAVAAKQVLRRLEAEAKSALTHPAGTVSVSDEQVEAALSSWFGDDWPSMGGLARTGLYDDMHAALTAALSLGGSKE